MSIIFRPYDPLAKLIPKHKHVKVTDWGEDSVAIQLVDIYGERVPSANLFFIHPTGFMRANSVNPDIGLPLDGQRLNHLTELEW